MTDEGKIRNIDSVLRMFDAKTEVSETEIASVHNTETRALIQTMLTLGIIFPLRTDERDRSFILGPAAYEIKTFGNYEDYLLYKKDEKKLAQQLIKSTLATNNLQKWLLAATSIFSLISVVLSIAEINLHKQELLVATEELRLHKLEKENCDCTDSIHKNPLNLRIGSSQQIADTLKQGNQ